MQIPMLKVQCSMSALPPGTRSGCGRTPQFSILNFQLSILNILLLACFAVPAFAAEDDLDSLEQKALAAAVERVAPSVLRVETVGGLEKVEKVLIGTGPTTALVVDPQGYLVSSAFNFVNKPASILVRLPDGTRKPAKLVCTDHNRMIVLLKVEVDKPLPVPVAAPESEMRVGQWCVGVGRAFEGERPNMSVGIVSALGRIWGKAIQADAAISPNNYGGPLVDIRGRVMGVIVPLSPQAVGEMAGYEWYDSGIGFAIPLEQILNILPRLKKGEDLYPGVIGVNLGKGNMVTDESTIASCRSRSPADKAGLKANDRVVEIDGRKVTRAAEVKEMLSRRYAGDRVPITVTRGDKQMQFQVELVAKLEAYQHPFLGVLPLRAATDKPGVTVRYVYPNSPAAGLKIEPADVIVSMAGKPVKNRDELIQQLDATEPGQEVDIEWRHGEQTRKAKVKLDRLPEALPPEQLPPAHAEVKPGTGQRPKVGVIPLRVPEFKNETWAYVPEGYDSSVSHGVLVLLANSASAEPKDLLPAWKPLCDRHDLLLVVTKAANKGTWQPNEATLVAKLVGQVKGGYNVDPARVAVFGRDTGAAMAYVAAFRDREVVRAVAIIDAVPMLPPPESDPVHHLAIYLATAKDPKQAKPVEAAMKGLRAHGLPVTQKDLGKDVRDLNPQELAELVRWIDMLDRI
jgi:serine protease Do